MESSPSPTTQAALAEYSTLQGRLTNYVQVTTQVTTVSVPIAGALVAFGYQQHNPVAILAGAATLIATLAGLGIVGSEVQRMRSYIYMVLEPNIPGLRWEHLGRTYLRARLFGSIWPSSVALTLTYVAVVVGLVALAGYYWPATSISGLVVYAIMAAAFLTAAFLTAIWVVYVGSHRYFTRLSHRWERVLKESAQQLRSERAAGDR
jgi:hypothetical protein